MKFMKLFPLLILMYSLCISADDEAGEDVRAKTKVIPSEKMPVIKSREACESAHGSWQWPPHGSYDPHRFEKLAPPPGGEGFCYRKTTDAGKDCVDTEECQTKCLAQDDSFQTHFGKCAGDNSHGPGCYSYMDRGYPAHALCYD